MLGFLIGCGFLFVIASSFFLLSQYSGLLCFFLLAAIASLFSLFWRSLKPTLSSLKTDVERLRKVISIEKQLAKEYGVDDVVTYYASTTFRDYKYLHAATGTPAMHSKLFVDKKFPFQFGQLKQILHVMGQFSDSAREGRVLEVGIGKGCNVICLAKFFPSAKFTGIDIVEEHVKFASKYAQELGLSNVSFLLQDATKLSQFMKDAESDFDIIFGIESFCHIDTLSGQQDLLRSASHLLKPSGKIIIVDGFRTQHFDQLNPLVQESMRLAESGFRIRAMPSKAIWKSSATAFGFKTVQDLDLTLEALPFWIQGWKVAHILLALCPFLVRFYSSLGKQRAETGASFVSVAMTAYAMALGSAEYGILVLQKSS